MDLIRGLRTFARIAEAGSFSAVARELGESHSAVTRLIGQLEEHFGVRLFHRTTRRLNLTEDGRELVAYARQLLDVADGMESDFGRHRNAPQGTVRLGTTIAFGMFLVPRMPALLERYPGLSVDLVMRDQIGDLIEERLDLATHVGPIADTSLVVRALATARRIAVAAPVYLERHGAPRTPAELTEHECILHNDGRDSSGWHFVGSEGAFEVRVAGRLSANNSAAVHFAALRGQGIAMLTELRVIDDIRAGRLHRVLAEFQAPGERSFIVYPSRRHLAPRTRVVIDFLVEQVSSLEHLGDSTDDPLADNPWLV